MVVRPFSHIKVIASGIVASILFWIKPENVFTTAPLEEFTSIAHPAVVYDIVPKSPIDIDSELYSAKWTFPTDYRLINTPAGRTMAVAADNVGALKAYQYDVDDQIILINTGWAITITKESSIIYFGPRNDDAGEVCILTPMGWTISGIASGEEMTITQETEYSTENWIKETIEDYDSFYIATDLSKFPKVIRQTRTFRTDTLAPVVQTFYTLYGVHRYDMKSFESMWYSDPDVSYMYRYVKSPVFGSMQSKLNQLFISFFMLDKIIDKYEAESNTFDVFRRS